MNAFFRLFLFVFICLPITLYADQLIVEPEMGRQPILNLMQQSEHTLDLVMYGLTDDVLIDEIIKQKKRGKTVKIILERTPYKAINENDKAVAKLNQQHVSYIGKLPEIRLIHQKTLLIDDQKALIMTFNFTNSTFKKTRNFALLIDDPKRVAAIQSIFDADWNHVPSERTTDNLILSPDNSRTKILTLIKQAKKSLHIYAQDVSDKKIQTALIQTAKRGVDVQIISSKKWREKERSEFANAGIKLFECDQYYIHAKVWIIDNQLAVIGSTNMTRASLDDNRELSISTNDKRVIMQLNDVFERDKQGAHQTARKAAPQSTLPFPTKAMMRESMRVLKGLVRELEKY